MMTAERRQTSSRLERELLAVGLFWRQIMPLRRLRRRVKDGDIGGELDGILSDDERNRLSFWGYLMKRKGIFDESER